MSYLATSRVRNELYRIAAEGFRHHNIEGTVSIKDVAPSEPFIIVNKSVYMNPPDTSGYQGGYELHRGSLLIKFNKDNVPKESRHIHSSSSLKGGCFFKIIVGHKENYQVTGPTTFNTYMSDYFYITEEELSKMEVEVLLLKDVICDGEPLYKGPDMEVETSFVDGADVLLCKVVQKQDMRPDNVRYLYTRHKEQIKISVQVAQDNKWKTAASKSLHGDRSFSVNTVMEIMDDKQLGDLQDADKRVFTNDQIYRLYMYAPDRLFALGVTSPRTLEYYLQHGVPIETLDQIRFLLAVEELDTTTFLEALTSGTMKTMMAIRMQNKIEQIENKLNIRKYIERSTIFG